MGARVAFALACCAATLMAAGAIASCGARTGLLEEEEPELDAGPETGIIAPDRFIPSDVVVVEDAVPPIDAFKNDVPIINPCPDAAATLIYVMGMQSELYSFDPSAGIFTPIGVINCPDSVGSPFSMAVDREGIAYVIFAATPSEGVQVGTGLFRVSTKTSECMPTTYNAVANGSVTFGMGFVANVGDGGDAGETLFVAKDPRGNLFGNSELATIDTTSFVLTNIGYFTPGVLAAELTGTGDGRLFAFSPAQGAGEISFIAEIDTSNANVIGEDPLPGIFAGGGWAFGFWGGDFYTFTGPSVDAGVPGTVVHRFDPVTKAITQVASLGDTIVGAGVSTCAPQN
jgi:hypothetical protein